MIKIVYNNKIRGQIKHDNQAQFDELYGKLCYQHTKFGANRTHEVETVCPISPVGSFSAGIALDLKRLEPDIEIDKKFTDFHFPYIFFNRLDGNLKQPLNKPWKYRSYQEDAIREASLFGRGIIDSPTGSGKSIIMYGIITNLVQMSEGRVLILVPSPSLVTQLAGDFTKYGLEDFGTYTSSTQAFPDAQVVITSRTVMNKKGLAALPKISHLMIDEVHKLIPKSAYERVVKTCATPSIFGFTATMPDDPKEMWYIKGMVGPVIFKEHTYVLQEQNYLAKVNIVSFKFIHKNKPLYIVEPTYDMGEHPTKMYSDEYHYLEGRLDTIETIANVVAQLKGNTMILFDHTSHGQALYKAIKGNKVFVDGKISMDEREDVKAALEKSNDLTLVAQSTCFGTGISINNIQNLIICSHSKRMSKIIQQVGRSLRKMVDGDEYVMFFDFHHNFKYSERHFYERVKLYKKFYNKSYDKRVVIEI